MTTACSICPIAVVPAEAIAIWSWITTVGHKRVGILTFNALFTTHGTTMVFLPIMPLGSAFSII